MKIVNPFLFIYFFSTLSVSAQNLTFNEHQIDLNFAGIHAIKIIDLDGDGDKDVVGGSEETVYSQSKGIAWWRNNGGNPVSWTRFTVDPFLKLAKYYYSKEDIHAAKRWTDKALLLSKRANDEDLIKKIEEMNW